MNKNKDIIENNSRISDDELIDRIEKIERKRG